MKKHYLQWAVASVMLTTWIPSYAGISFGDPNADTGKLTFSGYVRGNYQDKDYGEAASDEKIRFDAAQLKLDYERGKLFGHAEYKRKQ